MIHRLCKVALVLTIVLSFDTAVARVDLPHIRNHQETKVIFATSDGKVPTEARAPIELSFSAFETHFTLRLFPSPVVDASTRTFVIGDDGQREIPNVNYSYVGAVIGHPDSMARVTLLRGGIVGVVALADETYVLEPKIEFDSKAKPGEIVVYRASENPGPDIVDDDLAPRSEPNPLDALRRTREYLGSGDFQTVPDDSRASIVLSTGGLQRLQIGLVADSAFFLQIHDGDLAATQADMDSVVNSADALFRGGAPLANGSVPVTLKISTRTIFVSEAAQWSEGIARCPLVCMGTTPPTIQPGTHCGTSGAFCNGSAGYSCQELPNRFRTCESLPLRGQICLSNADCGTGACSMRCIKGTNAGVACSNDAGCPGGTCGREPTTCDGGSDDGELCQSAGEGCATYGNCCSTGKCNSNFTGRAVGTVGSYRQRIAPEETINTSNSQMAHLFTGCRIGSPGANNGGLCDERPGKGASITRHLCDPITGLCDSAGDKLGTFGHEVGHALGAYSGHDHGDECMDLTAIGDLSTGLAITRDTCSSGPDEDQMCSSSAGIACQGGASCDRSNEKFCVDGPFPGKRCYGDFEQCSSADLTEIGVCDGPGLRRCVGGANDGENCRDDWGSPCASPGTCTGAPMNWGIYFESGSGVLAGFSPCSQYAISQYINSIPSCLADIVCGDVTRSRGCVGGIHQGKQCASNADCPGSLPDIAAGACPLAKCWGGTADGADCSSNTDCPGGGVCPFGITSEDVDTTLNMSVSGVYDDLADVTGNGLVNSTDAFRILQISLHQVAPAATCGRPDNW